MATAAQIFLVSACGSGEEFVAAFRRYADRNGLFIPIAEPLAVGRRGRFALTLKDGGVMIEGEAEVISAAKTPSVLHGRIGMTIRFVAPDEPSTTTLNELLKARLALKPTPPSVAPRPASLPGSPRPAPPAPSGRIDAASALAECVAIGDDVPPKADQRFVAPSAPITGGSQTSTKPGATAPRTRPPSSSPVKSTQAVAVVPPPRPQTESPVTSLEDGEVDSAAVFETVEVTHRGAAPVTDSRSNLPSQPPPASRPATPATPFPLLATPGSGPAPSAGKEPIESTSPGTPAPRVVDKPSSGHSRDHRTTVLGVPIVPGGVPVLPAPTSGRSNSQPNESGEDTTSGSAFSSPTTGSFTSAEPIVDEPAFIEELPPPKDDWSPEPSKPSGNWAIELDPTRPDGWSAPAKVETPPEVEHAARDVIGGESDSAEMPVLPMRLSEPKVQLDPTFVDSLPNDEIALGDTLPRTPRARRLPGLPPTPVSGTAVTAPAFAPLPAHYPTVTTTPRPIGGEPPTMLTTPKRKRTGAIIAGVAAVAIAGTAAVVLTRGDHQAKPTAPRTTLATAIRSPSDPGKPPADKPPNDQSPTDKPPSDERTTTPAGNCQVSIASVPKGAEISLDDKTLGTTPTTLNLPCGVPAKLVARKARYAATVRTVTPRADQAKPVRVVLQRATFAVKVSSTPQGAKIMMGRKLMGVTPTSIKLPGFTPVTLKLTKDGYTAQTEKITPKQNNQAISVTLKKSKRR
ncbi:MAG: PEGA domain-containing protein [Kofleriaceae bacterium]